MDMYHRYVRDELTQMLFWHVGQQTNWRVCPGKAGKYLKNYLSGEEYGLLKATYSSGEEDAFWQAVFAMCRLFGQTARQVGERAGFAYPQQDQDAMTAYLRHVRALPKDAGEIYP